MKNKSQKENKSLSIDNQGDDRTGDCDKNHIMLVPLQSQAELGYPVLLDLSSEIERLEKEKLDFDKILNDRPELYGTHSWYLREFIIERLDQTQKINKMIEEKIDLNLSYQRNRLKEYSENNYQEKWKDQIIRIQEIITMLINLKNSILGEKEK